MFVFFLFFMQDNDPLLSCSPSGGALNERETLGGFPVKFLILVVNV